MLIYILQYESFFITSDQADSFKNKSRVLKLFRMMAKLHEEMNEDLIIGMKRINNIGS